MMPKLHLVIFAPFFSNLVLNSTSESLVLDNSYLKECNWFWTALDI